MGNSASNANNPNRTHRTDHSSSPTSRRDDSISPGPGNPHPSLRTKKKSLELPDFVSLTSTPSTISARGRQKAYTPATAIPIPTPPTVRNPFSHYSEVSGIAPQRHRPRNNFSSTISIAPLRDEFDDMAALLESPSIPFPPPSRAQQREQQQQQREQQQRQQQQQRSASKQRGRQPPMSSRQQQAQVARMQELYDQSLDPHHPALHPSSPTSASRPTYSREVVRSSIPVLLGEGEHQAETQENNVLCPIQEDQSADPVPLTVVWKGGGTEVILARAGDDDWKGRQPMERQCVSPVFIDPKRHTWFRSICIALIAARGIL
jgi:type II secretory pathway pseudopilin PulG